MKEKNKVLTADQIASDEVVQELLEKYDSESKFRKYPSKTKMAILISTIAILWSTFQLWAAGFGALEAIKMRAAHLTFVLVLIFLLYPARKKV